VLLLLGAILTVVWVACDWPPPRLILKYGFPPAGGPTGRRLTVEGVRFIELRPGYVRVALRGHGDPESLLAKVRRSLGLACEERSKRNRINRRCTWTELPIRVWFAETEVTESQYLRIGPRRGVSASHRAVSNVSWEDATQFCSRLRIVSALNIRLPTEEEWEYAYRAGSTTRQASEPRGDELLAYTWTGGNAGSTSTSEVGLREPNRWGLFDMLGGVSEWCSDLYPEGDVLDPTGKLSESQRHEIETILLEQSGRLRVLRGGAFISSSGECDKALRFPCYSKHRSIGIGFRPAFSCSNSR
jgi:formylglycine-generating enzyme required for sulfatase activity